MRRTTDGVSPLGILLPAAFAGLITTLVLMLLCAILVQRSVLPETLITPLALGCLSLGSAVAALLSARHAPGGKFLWALGAGAIVFLILLVVGALLLRQPVHMLRIAISLLCMLVGAALGGFVGAGQRSKKRYKHIKK